VRGVYPWHKPNLGTRRVEEIHTYSKGPNGGFGPLEGMRRGAG
jgi:hypothetical protein